MAAMQRSAAVEGAARAVREELVPVLIVTVLLALYTFVIVTKQTVPEDLKTLVASVTAFYFGGRTALSTASSVRQTANVLNEGSTNGGTH